MAKYLLIESRDPFDNNVVARQYELAINLVKEGNEVTLFLVQNGVLPARPGTQWPTSSRSPVRPNNSQLRSARSVAK